MSIPKGNPLPAESPTQSIALFERARRAIPGGVNSPVRAFRAVGGTPLFISRGQGAHVQDVDGRRFLDFVTLVGRADLGHAHPEVVDAIVDTVRHGTTFGAPTPGRSRARRARHRVLSRPRAGALRFVRHRKR